MARKPKVCFFTHKSFLTDVWVQLHLSVHLFVHLPVNVIISSVVLVFVIGSPSVASRESCFINDLTVITQWKPKGIVHSTSTIRHQEKKTSMTIAWSQWKGMKRRHWEYEVSPWGCFGKAQLRVKRKERTALDRLELDEANWQKEASRTPRNETSLNANCSVNLRWVLITPRN